MKILNFSINCNAVVDLELKSGAKIRFRICDKNPGSWLYWWFESLKQVESKAELCLILPKQSNYLLRRNILQNRLAGWNLAMNIFAKVDHDERLVNVTKSEFLKHPEDGFATAVCGILLNATNKHSDPIYWLDALDTRLTAPWTFSHQLPPRRVALITGGHSLQRRKNLFTAAKDLNIHLTVFDRPDHWLDKQNDIYDGHINFVPLNTSLDLSLSHRIVAAIKACQQPFDGITTISDSFLCATAEAAEALQLATTPAEVVNSLVNKELLRERIPLPTRYNTKKSGTIVKPSKGGGSSNVFLTVYEKERSTAVEKITALGKDAVTEAYIEGPEVDVNVVLLDGKVLFVEVVDNLPTIAEGFPSKLKVQSWNETGSICPSGLSDGEIDLLRDKTVSYLLNIKLRSGVFHCEARVSQSALAYTMKPTGWPRLVKSEDYDKGFPPEIAILEINARPPGSTASALSKYVSGIDYFALQLLSACNDKTRYSLLAYPFSTSVGWWGDGYIAAEKGGVFRPLLMFEELLKNLPSLKKYIVEWTVFFDREERIEDPSITGKFQSVAWYLARSDKSRAHLEQILEEVATSLKYDII